LLVPSEIEDGMAKKRTTRRKAKPPATPTLARPGVTPERFARLHQLVQSLSGGPQPRERLLQHLGLDVRGFYRDLEVLRACGVLVALEEGQYSLTGAPEDALARLPFPDAHLTLGEVRQLARGRSAAHRRLQQLIDRLLS
jgi:hypothetical protein